MIRIRYVIQYNTVFVERYDTELQLVVNFKGLYKGKSNKECEIWLKGYKEGLKKR